MATSTASTTKSIKTEIAFALPARLFSTTTGTATGAVLHCMDCHAAGEPARVVLGGLPMVPGKTALDKRLYMMDHMDQYRQRLLLEPRGYPCQNVNFVFVDDIPNDTNDNDQTKSNQRVIQYVIGEQNKIYPMMSGHNTICVATALLETNIIPMVEPITHCTLHAPAGPIAITAECKAGKAKNIAFTNAPAFVEHLDATVQVPELGSVLVDIAYGGMWYCVVDVTQFDDTVLQLQDNFAKRLCRYGEMIKVACREQCPVQHPEFDYPGVDILAFVESTHDGRRHRNAVIMSNNELQWNQPETYTAMIDRSPCGTGTCAVMAIRHAKQLLPIGVEFVHESMVGTTFVGTILQTTTVAGRPAIVPQIKGSAYITQYSQVVVDSEDPFPDGFRVSDIW